jgi:poly-beta-hydroxyalkanoate depolymerase
MAASSSIKKDYIRQFIQTCQTDNVGYYIIAHDNEYSSAIYVDTSDETVCKLIVPTDRLYVTNKKLRLDQYTGCVQIDVFWDDITSIVRAKPEQRLIDNIPNIMKDRIMNKKDTLDVGNDDEFKI